MLPPATLQTSRPGVARQRAAAVWPHANTATQKVPLLSCASEKRRSGRTCWQGEANQTGLVTDSAGARRGINLHTHMSTHTLV